MEGFSVFLFIIAVIAFISVRAIRVFREAQARIQRLSPPDTLFVDTRCKVAVWHPLQDKKRWQRAYFFINDKRLVIYPRKAPGDGVERPLFESVPHDIEGFWRPVKYQSGRNEIEIHVNIDGHWAVISLMLWQSAMMNLVRVLKSLVSDDIIRAYRQRRPYIYKQPEEASIAVQNIHGAWELDPPFLLYLMPSALVFFSKSDTTAQIKRVIRLRDLQNIRVVKRLDGEQDEGLVSFDVLSTQENISIAVSDYEAWAQAIAVAAKRTLEQPVTRKNKQQEDLSESDAEWNEDEFMESLWTSQNFVIGDDGELHLRE